MGATFSLKAYQTLWDARTEQLGLMGHSVLLSLNVTFLATAMGVPLGVLLGKTDLSFRAALTVLLTVPLLIPPYVIAVAWFGVLGSGGWISAFAPETSKYLSTAFFSVYGATGVLFTAFVPIVILLTIAYLGAANPRLEDAGRLVSCRPGVLRRITLPLIAPAILVRFRAGVSSDARGSRCTDLFALPGVSGRDPDPIRRFLRLQRGDRVGDAAAHCHARSSWSWNIGCSSIEFRSLEP